MTYDGDKINKKGTFGVVLSRSVHLAAAIISSLGRH